MGCNTSLPKKIDAQETEGHEWITKDTDVCKNCHFLKRHFSDPSDKAEIAVKASGSAEAEERKMEVMQRQNWEPCVQSLVYWGHSLSRITLLYLRRCSHCGNFIFGLWEKAYSCQAVQQNIDVIRLFYFRLWYKMRDIRTREVVQSSVIRFVWKKLGKAATKYKFPAKIKAPINTDPPFWSSTDDTKSLLKDKENGVDVQGHTFQKKIWKFRKCVKCKNCVITFFDNCLQCKDCKAVLHDSCIFMLERNCPSLYLSQGYKMLQDETNLSSQNFKCPDCNAPIFDEFEDCQYCYFSKKFFCHGCHRNKEAIIPENVLQQWCFCYYPVSDWSMIYLNYMKHQPVIAADDLSTAVKSFNGEIFNIMVLLEEIKNYYDYLPECQNEFDEILKQIRKKWPNVLQIPLNFSLSNLQDIFTSFENDRPNVGALYPQLVRCHEKVVRHVRRDCQKCTLHAQKCMVCDYKGAETTSENSIFYFERTVFTCKSEKCTPLNCVHRNCLRNNPLLTCKGCGTQMVTGEELSSICINLPSQRPPRVLRPRRRIAKHGSKKEVTAETGYSEIIFRRSIEDFTHDTRTVRDSLRAETNISRISSDLDDKDQNDTAECPGSTSVVNTDTSLGRTVNGKSKFLAKKEQLKKKNLEYYFALCRSSDVKEGLSDSTLDQTELCSNLVRHLQTESTEVTDSQGAQSLPLERQMNIEQPERQRHLQPVPIQHGLNTEQHEKEKQTVHQGSPNFLDDRPLDGIHDPTSTPMYKNINNNNNNNNNNMERPRRESPTQTSTGGE